MARLSGTIYVDGEWTSPAVPNLFNGVNPATEEIAGWISLGSSADVDLAAIAARRAFPPYAGTTREAPLALSVGGGLTLQRVRHRDDGLRLSIAHVGTLSELLE
jgi:hypothetical protein